jgi:hypothetical protein
MEIISVGLGNEARDLTMAQQLLDDILVKLRFCHVAMLVDHVRG